MSYEYANIRTKLGIDDFEIIESIGQGTFGTVLQVMKKDTRKVYAMKILKKKDLVKRGQVAHTWTERTILADIDHPFIVSLRFAFQTKDKLYMVLDFFTGGELFFHLKRERRFSENRTRFYIAEVLLALEHLHKNNIIYRDLKPENILVDGDGHIRLTDFGLSKDFDPEQKKLTGTFCGTAEYIAPEVIKHQPYDFIIDWWALGILTFELLAGTPPWQKKNKKETYESILHERIPYKSYFSTLAKLFLNATLERNPKKRLGANNGAEEVKEHRFFKTIDWDALREKKVDPEFKPSVKNEFDTSNVHVDPEIKQRNVPKSGSSSLAGADFLEFSFNEVFHLSPESPSSMVRTSLAMTPGREGSIGKFILRGTRQSSIKRKSILTDVGG